MNYCTQPPNKNGAQPQRWHVLEPELEEMLVPRKLSISPLESWLTVRYSLPKAEVSIAQEEVGSGPVQRYDCPPSDEGADVEEGEGTPNNTLQCKNVLKIRRRKMNRHKFKKLLKRRKFVRRRIKEGRKKKRQVRLKGTSWCRCTPFPNCPLFRCWILGGINVGKNIISSEKFSLNEFRIYLPSTVG